MLITLLAAAQLSTGIVAGAADRNLAAAARVAATSPLEQPAAATDRLAGKIAQAIRSRVGAHAGVIVRSVEILNPDAGLIEDVRPVANVRVGERMRFIGLGRAPSGPDRLIPVSDVVADVVLTLEHAHASRPIARGSLLGDADTVAAEHDLQGATLRPWPRLTAVSGAKALRDLPADACLGPGSVVLKPAVQSGQDVRAIARVAGVEAVATLVAAANGTEGDVIRVVNRDSRRALKARVVAPGVVEILHD
jgi:flagella basal body P-ring formation protein FlgA